MEQLGYPDALIVLHESIIRAGVARYKLARGGPAVAERELDRQRKLGFIWIDDIYEMLGRYEANRGRYPTFASFYPELKSHLDGLATRMPSIEQAYDARRPKIIASSPAQDATNVDPAVSEIRLEFDRPIAQRWGFNGNAETSGRIPDISGIRLEENDRVLVIGVKLQPNSRYEMPFFEAGDPALRSKDGVLLGPYTIRFSTGAARRRR